MVTGYGCISGEEKIRVIKKPIKSSSDIVPIKDSLVVPYVYTSAVSLKKLPVPDKKAKFFDMMLPAVLVAKTRTSFLLNKVTQISSKQKLLPQDQHFLDSLMAIYDVNNVDMLKSRLTTFPVSIVLAQAAIESAWGTSRFFLEANNPFGLWSFNSKEQRIVASSTRSGKKVYLRKFNNLEESIEAYLITLATGPFKNFRREKLKTQDPFKLTECLIDYSERRQAYVQEVNSVIKGNNLERFDSYIIDPSYIY